MRRLTMENSSPLPIDLVLEVMFRPAEKPTLDIGHVRFGVDDAISSKPDAGGFIGMFTAAATLSPL